MCVRVCSSSAVGAPADEEQGGQDATDEEEPESMLAPEVPFLLVFLLSTVFGSLVLRVT